MWWFCMRAVSTGSKRAILLAPVCHVDKLFVDDVRVLELISPSAEGVNLANIGVLILYAWQLFINQLHVWS